MRQQVDIRDVMRLSPQTVQRVTTERTVLHRPRVERPRVDPAPLDVRNVDPLIMDAALRLCGGDVSRINIREDGSVVITNRSRAENNDKAKKLL
jgi:hypothetical protein